MATAAGAPTAGSTETVQIGVAAPVHAQAMPPAVRVAAAVQQQQQQQQGDDHEQSASPSASPPTSGADNSTGSSGPAGQAGTGESEDDIWPEDVEQAFQEALRLYPPIGRRKLLENGKMYGRNELIAKYIFKRTNKVRTRKQVSSHIQVLGKKQRKQQEAQKNVIMRGPPSAAAPSTQIPPLSNARLAMMPNARPEYATSLPAFVPPIKSDQPMATPQQQFYSNAYLQQAQQQQQQRSAAAAAMAAVGQRFDPSLMSTVMHDGRAFGGMSMGAQQPHLDQLLSHHPQSQQQQQQQQQTRIGLRYFSAYLESETTPAGALQPPQIVRHHYAYMSSDMMCGVNDGMFERIEMAHVANRFGPLQELYLRGPPSAFYIVKLWANMPSTQTSGLHAVSAKYESKESLRIRCSTTVFSFGKAVVEKTQFEDPMIEGDSYVYYCNHSPVCEYMVHFIDRLRGLDSVDNMNRVLENFTVLQLLVDANTNAILMCVGFLFSVSKQKEPQHAIYKLVP